MVEPNEFLSVAEVAAILKVNQQTVRNLDRLGELPAVRVRPAADQTRRLR